MSDITPVLATLDDGLDGSLDRLFELLRIKSISTDPAFAGDCRTAAEWLAGDLTSIGFEASVRDTPGHPMVVAHHDGDGPHVLFYGHYDVQPVDPLNLWNADPFDPAVKEDEAGRKTIVGRGASDDKGQLMTFVEACRAFKAAHGKLPCKVTILFEGEEESGSPSLKPFLEANREELKADFALVCDTGMWDRETPAISAGLRGLVGEEVTVTAASRDLHSGLYGGAAANPIHILARVLADLHDEEGRVTIPGFYDGVEETPPQILKQWETLGRSAEDFLGDIGLSIPAGEKGRSIPRTDMGAPDGRGQRGDGRLYGRRLQDGDCVEGERQGLLPSRAQAGSRQDQGRVQGVREGAHPCRLQRGFRRARRLAGDPAVLRFAVPQHRQGGAVGRMAEAGRHHRPWAVRSPSSATSRPCSAWNRCWSASVSPTTASIRPTRNTTSTRSTRASAPGRASCPRSGRNAPIDPEIFMTIRFHRNDLPNLENYGGDAVAIDTETLGLNPHRDRLCVVQLSPGDGTADVVQIDAGQKTAPNLTALLGDPSKTKIFHYARFDLAVLFNAFGVMPQPVFCTKIASRLTRTYTDRHGLKDICAELLDVAISKQQQSSDWGAAELSAAQLEYAASDVFYLHRLKAILEERLAREDRTAVAEACFRFLPSRSQLDLMGWPEADIFAHS